MDNDTNTEKVEGFTKIPNYIIESLIKTKLTGSELMVFLVICRQTFGWHKRVVPISGTKIAKFTYFPTSYIFRLLNKLEGKNLIVISRGGRGCTNLISIELDPSSWIVNLRKDNNYILQDTTSSISQVNSSHIFQDTDKRNTSKETPQRNKHIAILEQKMVDLGLKKSYEH